MDNYFKNLNAIGDIIFFHERIKRIETGEEMKSYLVDDVDMYLKQNGIKLNNNELIIITSYLNNKIDEFNEEKGCSRKK